MSIFPNKIESLISKLQDVIPYVETGWPLIGNVKRHDWRPIWTLCEEIQLAFKGSSEFKTREEQQAAWNQFQVLRKKVSELADVEKRTFSEQSTRLNSEILREVKNSRYSMSADTFVGAVLGHTTIDEIKSMQARLNRAGTTLSENKHLMTSADKQVCFEAIQEARETHDRFWERHKALTRERNEATLRRRAEFEEKREHWIQRVKGNISRNKEKLDKARGAYERNRDRISDIKDKIRETDSPKWEDIYCVWLSEAEAKESDSAITVTVHLIIITVTVYYYYGDSAFNYRKTST